MIDGSSRGNEKWPDFRYIFKLYQHDFLTIWIWGQLGKGYWGGQRYGSIRCGHVISWVLGDKEKDIRYIEVYQIKRYVTDRKSKYYRKYTQYISFDQQFDPILIKNSEFYKKLKLIQKYIWKNKRKAKSIDLKRWTNNMYFKISRQNIKL